MAASVGEVIQKLKTAPSEMKLVVMHDGEYFDINVSDIRFTYVRKETSWDNETPCYGICDQEEEDSFQVLGIE